MSATAAEPASRGPGWLPGVLVVVATVLAVVSTLTTWVHSQVLDTDEWVETSDALLEDPQVQTALTNYLTDQLFTAVDLKSELEADLPEQLSGLAGPIAGALRAPASDAIERLVASQRFEDAWSTANRLAHEAFVRVLRDETRVNVSTADGAIVLDLGEAVRNVGEQVGIPQAALDRIPDDAGQVTLVQSSELEDAQTAVKVLDFTSWFMFVLVVALYALAVALSLRRRITLRSVGVGLVIAGLTVLLVRALSIRTAVNVFVDEERREPLAQLVASVTTELLHQLAWTGVVYGLLIIAFAELLGPHRWAVATRRVVAGATESTVTAIAATAGVVILVVVWSPGNAFDRWVTALTLLALAVGAVVTLIATSRREFGPTSAVSADDAPLESASVESAPVGSAPVESETIDPDSTT